MTQVAEKISGLAINQQLSQLQNLQQEKGQRFLRFSLNEEVDGLLPLSDLQEVINLNLKNILPVPEMPESILGIVNWRGKATWIVDLANLWGLSPWFQREPIPYKGMAILVHWQEETMGLLIEQVETIEIYNPDNCLPISPGMFSEKLRSLAKGYSVDSQGKTRIVLDINCILQAIA